MTDSELILSRPDNHHIYQDSTGFDYDITLARLDLENNKNERYQLKVPTWPPKQIHSS